MNLRDRLQRTKGQVIRSQQEDASPPGMPLPPNDASSTDLATLVNGTWVQTAKGRCLRVERFYPAEHVHGDQRLDALLRIPPTEWTPFVGSTDSPPFDPRLALFIDTETTGLSRDSGTYVFLMGLGSFRDDGFSLRQYFMPHYADEEALLDLLAVELEDHQGLVSFNGRCFDWPLVRARFILSRRPTSDPPHHLDLLPLSRMLWRRLLPSCALSSLEQNILGVHRSGEDIPSYLIPQLYHDYVQSGYAPPIARVFYHNEMDILSLVALGTRIGTLLYASLKAEGNPFCDFLALGRLYERVGRLDDALRAYQIATEGTATAHVASSDAELAAKHLSLLLKGLGRHDEAIGIWQQQLGKGDLFPYIELAKYLEHRCHDYAAARRIVLEAIERVRAQALARDAIEAQRALAELRHRLERLERRMRHHGRQNTP